MNLSRIFAQAFIRRLAFVLAAIVLAAMGIGTSRAGNLGCNAGGGCDEGAAYQMCQSHAASFTNTNYPSTFCEKFPQGVGSGYYRACVTNNGTCQVSGGSGYHYYFSKSCQQRTGDGDGPTMNGNAILVGGTGTMCFNGCKYGGQLGEGASQWVFSAGQTVRYYSGNAWVPTGDVCNAASGENPTAETEHCATVGEMTQCLQADGRHCAVTKSGRRICWRANETGTKVSKNEAATKSPEGAGINAPTVPPANNGNWEQTGTGTTSVSTGGGTTNNYNVTNYTSNYGTDGSGGGAEGDPDTGGEGDGDDDHGEVGGDGSCQGTFTCSGGDPVLCAMARQTYMARCEAEGRFDGEAGAFPGEGDGGAGPDPEPEDVRKTVTMGLGLLDDGGFLGGGSCPDFGSFNVMGQTIAFDADGHFCEIIGVARVCLLLLGAFIALSILVGRNDA